MTISRIIKVLTERPQDIEKLIDEIAETAAREAGRKRITDDDRKEAVEYIIYRVSAEIKKIQKKEKIIRCGSGMRYT